MKYHVLLTSILLFSWAFSQSQADMLTLHPSQDSSIYSEFGSRSDGIGPNLFSGKLAASQGDAFRRALLQFDVSSLPSIAVIQSAELRLFVNNSPSLAPPTVAMTLHPITTRWAEGSADTSTGPYLVGQGDDAGSGDPTWTANAFNVSTWSSAGGDVGGASVTSLVNQAGSTASFQSAQMANDVQAWLSSPASNFGWMLIGDETQFKTARRFAADENVPEQGPQLLITYIVPEPQTIVYLFLGLMGCLHHRRRR